MEDHEKTIAIRLKGELLKKIHEETKVKEGIFSPSSWIKNILYEYYAGNLVKKR